MSSQRTNTTQQTSRGGMRTLNLGKAAARAVCEGRQTSLVVPGAARRWLPQVGPGAKLRLAFNGRRRGSAIIQVAAICFHQEIAEIPGCGDRHDPNAIDGEDTWEQILYKAQWGAAAPLEPEAAERRAAKGWYVLDFTARWRDGAWCAARGIAEPTTA